MKINPTIPKIELQASIVSIDNKGLATVQFSEDMVIPANYSKFNDGFLKITVFAGEDTQAG